MKNELDLIVNESALSTQSIRLREEVEAATAALGRARAKNTVRGYASDMKQFGAWLEARGLTRVLEDDVPTETVAQVLATYVTAMARGTAHPDAAGRPDPRRASTIGRRLAAVSHHYRRRSAPDPTKHVLVADALAAARRDLGVRPRQKIALSRVDASGMADCAADARDRCIVLMAVASACRRSELSALDAGDVTCDARGAKVLLRWSKTDQQGAGRVVGIPRATGAHCPVAAIETWTTARGPCAKSDPFFINLSTRGGHAGERMSGASIAGVIKRTAALIGLDPAEVGAHSARAGYVTIRAERGDGLHEIAEQTGHQSLDTLQRYIRSRGAQPLDPKKSVF